MTGSKILKLLMMGAAFQLLPFTQTVPQEQDVTPRPGSFDDIESRIEAGFDEVDIFLQAEFDEIDKLIKESYEAAEKRIEEVWGADGEMPDQKKWVGYSEDLSQKVIVDYEKGEITIQSLEPVSKEILEGTLKKIIEMPAPDLTSLDPVVQEIRKRVVDFSSIEKMFQDPTFLSPEEPELAQLVDIKKAVVVPYKPKPGRKMKPKPTKAKPIQLKVKMKSGWNKTMANRYIGTVRQYATKYNLKPSLLLALIHTESAFNPRARSHVPAYGLMQLVPTSGGLDAWNYLNKDDGTRPQAEMFYNPTENIKMGATYFYIVYSRYLRGIKDPTTRAYATISAYNTGSGNVAKSYGKSVRVKDAVKRFNNSTPQQAFDHLVKNLPYEETRHYLERVNRRMALYESFDN